MPIKDSSTLINQPNSNTYSISDWRQGYQSLYDEHDYWIDDIEGQIPPELNGTFFRNGPGLLDIHGYPLHHPFDGDGMIVKVSFANGRAHFSNRYVRTAGFVAEQKAGKPLYRGVFGTQKPGGFLANIFDTKIKNIANTNVIYWGDKLLAMWEAAEPHRLDPQTLETIGLDYLDGLLKPGDAWSAHPRIDPHCAMDGGEPCLVNFSVKIGPSTKITISEFNPNWQLLRKHTHTLPGFAFLHDMVITPNYCIFLQNPVSYNPLPFLLGFRSAAQCLQFNPKQPTKIILIPRNGQDPAQILEAEKCFVFHHANAWEEDDEIFIDSVAYDSFSSIDPDEDFWETDFDKGIPGELWRFRVNLTTQKTEHQVIDKRCVEFPTLHPQMVGRPYRYMYIGGAAKPTGNAPLQTVVKLDLVTEKQQIWSAGPRGFVGEPLFLPRPGGTAEDDGWLLVLVYDAAKHRSDMVILDAADLNRDPVARLHLKHHIPYGLHGSFTGEWFGPSR
ncbi:MAG: carotenoid oxygenase family protein [Oscillatoriaceae cyanobacterium]